MPGNSAGKKRYVFLAIRVSVVSIGIAWAVAWVSRGDRWSNLITTFSRVDLWVFTASLAIFMIGQLIVVLRWRVLLKTQDIHIELGTAVKLHLLGLFYNNFLPSAVGGDLLRAWYVTKHTDKKFEAALSVFVDRIVGLASTLVIAMFFNVIFLGEKGLSLGFGGAAGWVEAVGRYRRVICWIAVGTACILAAAVLAKKGRLMLRGSWLRIRDRSVRIVGRFRKAVIIYCASPLAIMAVFGLTLVMQIMVVTGFWLVGRDMGIEANIIYYYVFFPLTWVMGAIPISIGGAVIVEGVLAGLFVKFAGVDVAPAVALALSQRIIWMVGSVPGAVIHLLGAHLPKDFSIDYGQKMD